MILPHEDHLSPEQIKEVEEIVHSFGCRLQPIIGTRRTIYAILGDERHELMINRIEGLPYIDRIDRIQTPFKLMDIRSDLAQHEITISGKTLKKDAFYIAGHCTIDPKNKNYFFETSQAVKEAGASVIRGGVWKPRTNPHSYQGDSKAIDILLEAKERTGLPVITEVMDEYQLDITLEAGIDMLQIGARNALNYSLLKIIGKKTKDKSITVLLKRGMHMGAVNEFISAAEYIAAAGNPNIALCPRGTLPALDTYRNHPDESSTQLIKERTWAPVIVDPSHSVGKSIYVPSAALAAIAYGADGLIIETHVQPSHGIGDDPKQAITPDVLKRIIEDANEIRKMKQKYKPEMINEIS